MNVCFVDKFFCFVLIIFVFFCFSSYIVVFDVFDKGKYIFGCLVNISFGEFVIFDSFEYFFKVLFGWVGEFDVIFMFDRFCCRVGVVLVWDDGFVGGVG